MRLRLTPITGLVVFAILGLSSCGGSDDEVLAHVDGVGSITAASLNHWVQVEAILNHELIPTRPIPSGVVPDPPSYSACISYLRREPQPAGQSPGQLTTPALKARCKQAEHTLRESVLSKLISWDWTIGSGQQLGMKVDERQRLDEVIKNRTLYGDNFKRYLKLTKETMADVLFRSRVSGYEVQISKRLTDLIEGLPKNLTETQRQEKVTSLTSSTTKAWLAKTTCRSGFVVSSCKEYKGSEPPPSGPA
jgi:foldase protein PrsA